MDQTHDVSEEAPSPPQEATPAPETSQSRGKQKATSSRKSRQFFSNVQPLFTLQPPPTQLEFLDYADPSKDKIVRKKAREYVNRNRDATRLRAGSGSGNAPTSAPATSTAVWVLDSGSSRDKRVSKDADSSSTRAPRGALHRRQGLSGKGSQDSTLLWMTPQDVLSGQFDPFSVLPEVGRPVNHLIEFSTYTGSGLYGLLILHRDSCSHFLTSCPEELPFSDGDNYVWQERPAVTTISRDNTVLGCMIVERVSYVLWLFATAMIKDAMNGQWGTDEYSYFYQLALTEMRKEATRHVEQFTDAFMGALACFTAAANFNGQWAAAEMHRNAMIKAVKLKGRGDLTRGLRAFKPWTQKAMLWCEFHVAAQGPAPPTFPYLPPTSSLELPSDLISEAQHLQALTLSQLPFDLAAPLPDILLQLHELSISTAGKVRWPMSSVQIKLDPSISRTLYNTEYELLHLLALHKGADSAAYPPIEVLLAETAQMYMWTTIRMLPPVMKLCDLFVTRLKTALLPYLSDTVPSQESSAAAQPWPAASLDASLDDLRCQQAACDKLAYPHLLAWPLFLGTFVAATRPEGAWFKAQLLRYIRDAEDVRDEEEWKGVLRMFPFTEALYGLGMRGLDVDYGGEGEE